MAWVRGYVEGNQHHLFLEIGSWNDKQVTTVLSNIDSPAAMSSDLDVTWLKDGRVLYTLPEPPPHERDRNYWEIRTNWRTGEVSGRPRRLTNWFGYETFNITASADGKRLAFIKTSFQSDFLWANWRRVAHI
jgi:hypothetical protein